ncbi:MAG: hypothetical protein AAB341_00955 [Planctomycetota bacterium]
MLRVTNAAALLTLVLAGCPAVVPVTTGGGTGDFVDGNRDESVTSPFGKTSGEPDDDFATPVVAVFDASGVAELKGTVATSDDLDVFLLGALEAGDRVIIDAFAAGAASLDVSIAVFDEEERLVSNNDDRTDSNLDSRIDFIVRHRGDRYHLVVTRSAFPLTGRSRTGAYTVDVQVIHDNNLPPPVMQVLLLDFDGEAVNSPVLGTMTLAPFNAGDIDRDYNGETDTIKQVIREVFDQNYRRFNVTVLTTDDPPPANGTKFSTIFFGGFDETAFGIAENVDLYNADLCDDAVIFTESFTTSLFTLTPTAEEMGLAIGNVASHEAGHLLGLNHVDDDLDLMDDRSLADAFLLDQEFMDSRLSTDIMPIGTQDGALLLNEIVGSRAAELLTMMRRGLMHSRVNPASLGGVEIVRRLSPRKVSD